MEDWTDLRARDITMILWKSFAYMRARLARTPEYIMYSEIIDTERFWNHLLSYIIVAPILLFTQMYLLEYWWWITDDEWVILDDEGVSWVEESSYCHRRIIFLYKTCIKSATFSISITCSSADNPCLGIRVPFIRYENTTLTTYRPCVDEEVSSYVVQIILLGSRLSTWFLYERRTYIWFFPRSSDRILTDDISIQVELIPEYIDRDSGVICDDIRSFLFFFFFRLLYEEGSADVGEIRVMIVVP